MQPIDFFWRAAARWPDRCAIDAPEGPTSYAQLAAEVRSLAAALIDIDARPQGRVAICAQTNKAHIVALLATLAAGKVWIPLNSRTTRSEIARILQATEPSIVIADAACLPLVEDRGNSVLVMGEGAQPSDERSVGRLASRGMTTSLPADFGRDDVQAIKFTGGTTGLPKGVMQPRRAWCANIANQIAQWQLDEDDRYVVSAPISHGTSTYMLPILAQGGCHVIPRDYGLPGVLHAFRELGGTVSFMPPTLIYMMMSAPGVARAHFPKLKRLIYGAAPMPREKVREVRDFFGPVLGTTYGQTEAPQIVTVMTPEDFEDEANWASVGRPSWFTRVGIMSPEGALLAPGEIGEVVIQGDLTMTGYWRNPEKTAETLQGGWLHTGDRGVLDERGYLYLKDRIKDMVITGGFNVYPVDVEGALSTHPAVHECTVFGIPDDKWGEAVHAAVQLRAGQSAVESELIAYVRERLGPVQTPKRIHFVADLPRSSVGKVLKADARRKVLEGT